MNKTEINWTSLSWNPASGCTKVSAGCKYCYAETLAERKRGTRAFPNGFDITIRPHKLDEPARIRKPSLIFTNSMSDLFHEDISESYRDQILDAMHRAPHHRYQVLTKRIEVAERYFRRRPVPNCMWLGVTVEHALTLHRIDTLRSIDAPVRFVSVEPIIGPLGRIDLTGIHWLITGGESGSHASNPKVLERRFLVRRGAKNEPRWVPRADRMDWIREIRDQCLAQGVAHWFKQWGGPTPKSGGRTLDGRTWDEMPVLAGAMPQAYDHAHRHLPLVPVKTKAA